MTTWSSPTSVTPPGGMTGWRESLWLTLALHA